MLGIVLCLIAAYVVYFYRKVSKYPKGPFPLPFLGNAFQINPEKLQFDIERFREIYGDVFTLWLFGIPTVIITREEAIREALITKSDLFLNRTNEFPFTVFQSTENGGIIFSSGENWKNQRRESIHILRDFGMGKNVMEQKVHEQIEILTKEIRFSKNKEAMDLFWPIQVFVANVINNILYGFSYPHNKSERLMKYATDINSIFGEMFSSIWVVLGQIYPPSVNFPYIGYRVAGRYIEKYKNCLEFVKEDVKKSLENYSKEEEPACFAQAYFQKLGSSEFINMENLYNVSADFFVAGMETTTNTLRWALLYIAGNQEMQSKIRSEIAGVVGFDRLPSLRDKPSMPYTSAFIMELQRISNVIAVSITRRITEDTTIIGVFIPAGTDCVPQIHSCQLDERFFPEPKKFDPNRFVSEDGTFNTELAGHTMQFGLGKRQCAGESLAKMEIFLGLTALIQRFYLHPAEGHPIDYAASYGTFVNPVPTPIRLVEVKQDEL